MEAHQETLVRLLKKSRYLHHIEEEKIRQLALISRRYSLDRGTVLLHQDEPNQNVYIIIHGSVSVFIDQEFVYTLCRSGDVLGEMSVITGGPSNATITADQAVELIEIPSATLKQIHGDTAHELHSALYHWFSSILTDKLYKISQKAKRFETINRRLQHDLSDAKLTQDRIFSAHTRPIEIFPLTLKCEFSNILGGDFYAVFPVCPQTFGILIGDVSGHGTGACLLSMMIFNLFLAFAREKHSSAQVVSDVNQMALQFMHQGKFATLFYGIYHPGTRQLTYTNAGHHPGLVLREKKIMALPATNGIPVGILENGPNGYQEKVFRFLPGDRLFLFTDAVFEGHPGSANDISSLTELAGHIETLASMTSRQMAKALHRLRHGSGHPDLMDDFTLMIFDQQ